MRLRISMIGLLAIIATTWVGAPVSADKKKSGGHDRRPEQSISATDTVSISLCVISGDITVRGWERKEVRARAGNASRVELRRDGTETAGPASHLTVLLSGSGAAYRVGGVDCQVFGDVELDVPRGAMVHLRSGDGNVRVTGVAGAFVETQSGDVDIAEVSQAVEAGTLNGSLSVKNCAGRARLHSVGGNITASNMRAADNDNFSATSVSGEISLDRIGHQQITARTATGSVTLAGPLVKGGRYSFGTVSGDVTLKLPADSSFQLNAKVSTQGDIVSAFPLKVMNDRPTPGATGPVVKKPVKVVEAGTRKMIGSYGSGDATLALASFSGLLSLQKE